MKKRDEALFYTCSLIEYISRITKNKRIDVVKMLGDDIGRIYEYQDVFHCEPVEKVADDFLNIIQTKFTLNLERKVWYSRIIIKH